MKSYTTIILLLVLLTMQGFGQIGLEWEMVPETGGDNLNYPYDQTNVTANDYRVFMGLPVVLSNAENGVEKTPALILVNEAFYSNKHLKVQNWPQYSFNALQQYQLDLLGTYDHMVSFGYSATLLKTFSPKWAMMGIGGFTYASMTPDNIKLENMGAVGGLAGIRSWKSGWELGFGLYYGRLTGVDQLLPIIIVQRKTEKSVLSVSIPSGISYWYRMNKNLALGLATELQGDSYTENRYKAVQYDENGQFVSADNKVSLAYSSVTLGPALKYTMNNNVTVLLRTGMAMVRRYQYWLPKKAEALRYAASPDYLPLTGHDYSGEEVEFPIKDSVFIKLTVGYGL